MVLVDVHSHLDLIKELDPVIERARKTGVKSVITSGFDVWSNRKAIELSKKYDIVHASVGLYPLDAAKVELGDSYSERNPNLDVDKEIQFIRNSCNDIIAIGEVGMDLKHGSDEEEQRDLFEKFIKLAKELQKPLIIHSRAAEKQVIDILEDNKVENVILHCFCGSVKLIKRAADLGYSFSIPAIIVRSEQFQNLVRIVELKQLLTETDAPLLSPFRGKENEPCFVLETIKKIAEIKDLGSKEVEDVIFENYEKVFR